MALETPECFDIRDVMPLDHITEHHEVHVALEERHPISNIGSLRLGKAADLQVAAERGIYR
jgi:hypothetical protein